MIKLTVRDQAIIYVACDGAGHWCFFLCPPEHFPVFAAGRVPRNGDCLADDQSLEFGSPSFQV